MTTPSQPAQSAIGEMVQFLTRWAPFEGGEEEILPTFGITPAVFYARVVRDVMSDPALAESEQGRRLIAYCLQRAHLPTGAG